MRAGDALGGGWVVERITDDTVRFSRPAAVDRRRAGSRLIVMGGCLAVALALTGVSVQSAESLWLITSSLIALFGGTAVVALLSAVVDLRRAALGVSLELSPRQVTGVVEGRGLWGQFSVRPLSQPRSAARLALTPFEDSTTGAGMLTVSLPTGERLLAPDFPRLDDARLLLARLGLHDA